jgi:hypothetical protein
VANVKMLYVDRENVRILVPIIAGVTKACRSALRGHFIVKVKYCLEPSLA